MDAHYLGAMMKRFILFVQKEESQDFGWETLIGSFDTAEECYDALRDHITKLEKAWQNVSWQIADTKYSEVYQERYNGFPGKLYGAAKETAVVIDCMYQWMMANPVR